MAETAKVKYWHETIEVVYGTPPLAKGLANRFERLVENELFLRHLNGLRAFQEGLDPIPHRDAHEDFLRAVGHDFVSVEVYPWAISFEIYSFLVPSARTTLLYTGLSQRAS